MNSNDKMASSHIEERMSASLEKGSSDFNQVERVPTVEIDNYHGLSIKVLLVLFALCVQYFVQLFNIVGSGTFARNIAAAIGGADETVWLSQAIVIVTVVLGPPASQAADYFGRKWFLVVGSGFGFVGALILSRANTMGQAIGGQTISSILYIGQPILIAVASEVLPRKFRPIAQGALNVAGAAGAIVGTLAGSAMVDGHLYGWRIYWYIVAAMLAISAVLIAVLYNPVPRPLQRSLTLMEKLACLDWVAYFLLAAGLVLFNMGLSWGNNPYSWRDAHVLAPLVVGACFFIGLIVHQVWLKKDGLIHHDLFKKDRNFALALGCFFADGMIFWAANNFYSYQVSVLYSSNTILIGLHYALAFIAATVAAASIAIISTFTKRLREPIVISFILFTCFYACMATTTLTSTHVVWGYPILLGVGLGWSLTYLVTVAQLSTPPHLIATTSGILLAIRSFGGSVALAIFTAIFNSRLANLGSNIAAAVLPLGFPPAELPAFIGALAGQQQAVLVKLPGVTPQIIGAGVHALQDTFLVSFKGVWYTAAAFSAATVIATCFILNPNNDLNNHVDAPLDE